ncbi:carboxymuconolactone decarboxylase [Rhodospirillum rubrum]|uniref:carboxymuconolactone decarboxylase family protein n=1 Tax=Rhodospirillum rubrum TaxID=1085 RepID=UPI0019077022|nr:carboxymuconolactone decarboxylase family protein [Rhodospirillum rubrum]MBK1665474.1 carboxymuconolactone decarboxylase [Rhodospirillum rubrum]MBK1677416.1 carboxymuconolactone decarboxylase [Rhodospirillum rubrum]
MAVSKAFERFFAEAPGHAKAWMAAVQGLDQASGLDKKTEELAYLGVLAAARLPSGIAFHVQSAKAAGASREEIIGAVLIGLPAVGAGVIEALPIALDAYDQSGQ